MDKKVIGVFETELSAVQAIERLKLTGYTADEISVLAKQSDQLDRIEDSTEAHVEREHSAKSAVGGAVAGGVIGGIGALLLDMGLLAIPGIGPFLAAGPIAVTLTGIVAGGALGGLAGALIDMGLNETDAKEYETYLNDGKILVLVDEKENRKLVEESFYENESLNRDRYASQDIRRDMSINQSLDRDVPVMQDLDRNMPDYQGLDKDAPVIQDMDRNTTVNEDMDRERLMNENISDRKKGVSGMNKDIVEGKWEQVKGDVQKKWGKLTNDDLDVIKGDTRKLAGKLQEKYGWTKEEVEKEMENHNW
ncbi:MAG: CsbD family protein [Tissierellia bacterium]|nr:CsbD family protein [Tissierellia bacterium]